MVHNKLVRDRIPEIIASQGKTAHTRILDSEEYVRMLEQKLDEEAGEYHRDKTIEELADILEVVLALAELQGVSVDELWEIYRRKHEARGGFRDRVFLESVED